MQSLVSQIGPAFGGLLRVTGSLRITVALIFGIMIYMLKGDTVEVDMAMAAGKPLALAMLAVGLMISDALRRISPEKQEGTEDQPPGPPAP
jgi:hypothetical protein